MKDFSVRPLDEYPYNELEDLLISIALTKETAKTDSLDVWGYRINEAMKNKRKMVMNGYEETKPDFV
jgi:hypothetical protein